MAAKQEMIDALMEGSHETVNGTETTTGDITVAIIPGEESMTIENNSCNEAQGAHETDDRMSDLTPVNVLAPSVTGGPGLDDVIPAQVIPSALLIASPAVGAAFPPGPVMSHELVIRHEPAIKEEPIKNDECEDSPDLENGPEAEAEDKPEPVPGPAPLLPGTETMINRAIRDNMLHPVLVNGQPTYDYSNPFILSPADEIPLPVGAAAQTALVLSMRQDATAGAIARRAFARPQGIIPLYVREWRGLTQWLNLIGRVQMTPAMNAATGASLALNYVLDATARLIPAEVQNHARLIQLYWEDRNWGAPANANPPAAAPAIPPVQPTTSALQPTTPALQPQAVDDLGSILGPHLSAAARTAVARHFRPDGIAYGIIVPFGEPGRPPRLNRALARRSADVYGRNGLANGAWFAWRMNAIFAGAHGASQAGVHGTATNGAYSVVIAGAYAGIDMDRGDRVGYSAPRGNQHESLSVAPGHTRSPPLDTSFASRRPVRVLRSHSGDAHWSPLEGLRYDGLYRVIARRSLQHDVYGPYTRYELERLPGQPPIRREVPSNEQVADLAHLNVFRRG